MSVATRDACVPVFVRYLGRLRALLDAAEAHAASQGWPASQLLGARLADDMNPFATQVVITANFALRACFPLAGQAIPPDEQVGAGFAGLRARIDRVCGLLNSLAPELFEGAQARVLQSQAGEARVSLPAPEFLLQYAFPNFFFHLSMAYAILRSRGVAIGKADFDGFHAYPTTASRS